MANFDDPHYYFRYSLMLLCSMCWKRTCPVGSYFAGIVVAAAADCSCASFSQLASSALHLHSAGADHCYESSQVLDICCRGNEMDEVVAEDIHDTASLLLRHSQRNVAFRGRDEREGGNCVVAEAGAELRIPSERTPDKVASAEIVAAPLPAERTSPVASFVVEDSMGMVAVNAASPQAMDEPEETFAVMVGA